MFIVSIFHMFMCFIDIERVSTFKSVIASHFQTSRCPNLRKICSFLLISKHINIFVCVFIFSTIKTNIKKTYKNTHIKIVIVFFKCACAAFQSYKNRQNYENKARSTCHCCVCQLLKKTQFHNVILCFICVPPNICVFRLLVVCSCIHCVFSCVFVFSRCQDHIKKQ